MEATYRHKQLLVDYRLTFNSETGERVLEDLKDHCHFFDSCIREKARDTDIMLGERNVYLYILAMLSEDPNQQIIEEVRDYE